jgi:hypothetical protein
LKILDLIFCRLLYLYRKEKKGAIDSASNYLTTILLVVPISIVATIINVFFMPENGWNLHFGKASLFLIVAPVYYIVSILIKRLYRKRIDTLNVELLSEKLQFNLFTLWIFIVILALMPVLLPKVL